MYEYLENNMVFYISYIYNEYLDLDELINLWSILNRILNYIKIK